MTRLSLHFPRVSKHCRLSEPAYGLSRYALDHLLAGETPGVAVALNVAAPPVANADSGFVTREHVLEGSYEIEVAGERVRARVSLEPFYDPKSARVKA